MTTTPAQLAGKFHKLGATIGTSARDGVNGAARILAAAGNANLAASTGGDSRLSGVPKAQLRVTPRPATSTTDPAALVTGDPPGLFSIVEGGAHPHLIGAGRGVFASSLKTRGLQKVSKTGKARKASGRKLLTFGDGQAAFGPFVAGGSPAKRPLGRAGQVIGPKVPALVARETRASIVKAGFRG